MNRMFRVILFDIDGTLIHAQGAGGRAFERASATMFDRPEGTRHLDFCGRTDLSLVAEYFDHHGIEATPANHERFFSAYLFWLDHLLERESGRTIRGVRKFLNDLQQQPDPPVLALLTGNILMGAQIKLRHFDLWSQFQFGAFGCDHADRGQLAVLALKRAERHLRHSLRGEEILVVGDTPHDIACGREIGARTLAVSAGNYSQTALRDCGPDWAVEHYDELTPGLFQGGSNRPGLL